MGQAKSLSVASLGEDLKGINQQMTAKPTTATILEETAEPQQIHHAGTLPQTGQRRAGLSRCQPPSDNLSRNRDACRFQGAPGASGPLWTWVPSKEGM